VVSIVAGILLSQAMKRGLDTSAPVWLILTAFIGLLLGAPERPTLKSIVSRAILPSTLLPVTLLGVWVVRFLAEWSQHPGAVPKFGPRPGGSELDTTQPLVQLLLVAFVLFLCLATLLVVSLAGVGKRPIIMWLARVNKVGPKGFKRMQGIVEAVAGLVAALASTWLFLR
jgi:hypothetical protein